jgi:hypothetical protein
MPTKSPEEHFLDLKGSIEALANQKFIPMNIPPEEAAHETRRLSALVATYYHRLLNESNVSPEYLNTINARAEAFTYTISLRDIHSKTEKKDWQLWLVSKKEGYTLRKKLTVKFRYAMRQRPDLLKVIDTILLGRGDLDMIKDLLTFYTFGAQNLELLNSAKIDPSLIERAKALHELLSDLIARLEIDIESIDFAEKMSAMAWTYFMNAASEIYAAGRFVFMDEPEIEELFYIDFLQKKRPLTLSNEKIEEDQSVLENS